MPPVPPSRQVRKRLPVVLDRARRETTEARRLRLVAQHPSALGQVAGLLRGGGKPQNIAPRVNISRHLKASLQGLEQKNGILLLAAACLALEPFKLRLLRALSLPVHSDWK